MAGAVAIAERTDPFLTTHWSVVLAAGLDSSPQARAALEHLCRTYWYPLYACVCRKGHNEHDAHVHEHDILHRDLKPSNVLLDEFDQPRVTDFGLAKRLVGTRSTASVVSSGIELDAVERVPTTELTLSGQVLGSPSFIAPEQAAGKKGAVGPASDIYSLGALLYHLIAGRAPFQAATIPETLHQVLERDPLPPHLLVPAIPRDLETICLKCLEKEPGLG